MINLNFKQLNNFAAKLENTVRKSGKAIMKVYNSDFEVTIKKDESPVTKADTIAEEIILKDLIKLSEDIPIIAEENIAEFGFPSFKGNTFWCIDALDGTKEFINLRKDFTVNIGLIVNGKPSLGLVYAPAKDTLYRGTVCNTSNQKYSTVERSGKRRPISVRSIPKKGAVIARSASHGTKKEMEEFLKKHKVDKTIAVGSSIKFCMIAEGIADFYPRFGPTHEWDTAAGHAILTAAGGSVKMPDGNELMYKKENRNYCNGTFIAAGLT